MILGCIGDDFTGSSDIANTLSKQGMRVTQYTGIPNGDAEQWVEAGVVSLKSRTIKPEDAIAQSLEAARWLKSQGCKQIFFKYCSTFDSTREGNIGPVAEALADYLGEDQVVFCPAFPATGRSIYQGHLFVNDTLLSESGMKDHPLTPMSDSDLRRWLGYQTDWAVKHVSYSDVLGGSETVADRMKQQAPAFYIADAIRDEDLEVLGRALKDRTLITGGSGLALGLPENYRQDGLIGVSETNWTKLEGKAVLLSGSCSVATRGQVAHYKAQYPSQELTAEDIFTGIKSVSSVCDWVLEQQDVPLVYTSADPEVVKAAQEKYGQELIADKIETFMGDVASELLKRGVNCIITAGGETSGAVVKALDIKVMEIGPEIAAGVPALRDCDRELVLALKSGNFGKETFFEDALSVLQG